MSYEAARAEGNGECRSAVARLVVRAATVGILPARDTEGDTGRA